MAKRRYGWTENKIEKYIKEGRGNGELGNYKPWLTVHDVPSEGNSSRIKGWKTGRNHHFFSNIERNYFYLLEWSDIVLDIREQFPLDRVDTVDIANHKEIKHIEDRNTKTLIPMTTDFVVTLKKDGKIKTHSIAIKPSEQLEDKNVLKKLEVEREYWNNQGISWNIVTEKDIPAAMTKNIQWLHSFRNIESEDKEIAKTLLTHIIDNPKKVIISLFDFLSSFDEDYLLKSGMGLNYFRYLLANKLVSLDIHKKIDLRNTTIQELTICNRIKGSDDYGNASGK